MKLGDIWPGPWPKRGVAPLDNMAQHLKWWVWKKHGPSKWYGKAVMIIFDSRDPDHGMCSTDGKTPA